MHQRGNQARSKADYYLKHLFIRILRHTLGSGDDETGATTGAVASSITKMPRSSSPDMMREEEEESASGEWGEKDDDKTLAGSRFSAKRVGSMRKAQASAMPDLEQGPRGRSRTMSSLHLVSITAVRLKVFISMTISDSTASQTGGGDDRAA